MTPVSQLKLFLICRAVPSCEYAHNLCPSPLAAGRSHQSQSHANPMQGWVPCKKAPEMASGAAENQEVWIRLHIPFFPSSLCYCHSVVPLLFPLVCQRGRTYREQLIKPVTGKPHFRHSVWFLACEPRHNCSANAFGGIIQSL